MYKYLAAMGIPETHIAGVLSNFSMENGADPTSYESWWLKYPNTGYKADPAKLSVIGTGENFPDWDSIDKWTRNVVWARTKGIYKPGYHSSMPGKEVMGIGIGSWTGKVGEDFLNYAKSTGKPWYDMKTQMDYFTNSESLTRDGFIAFDKKYRTKANMQEWWKAFANKQFKSPTDAASWYFYNAEMPNGSASQAAQHTAQAQSWYDKIQQWKTEGPGSSNSGSTSGLIGNMGAAAVNGAQNVLSNAATSLGNGVGLYGAGTGLDSTYNVKSMAKNVRNWNNALKKNNVVTDISKGFNNISQISRGNYIDSAENKNDTTSQILAFLTENIGTLIQYVATIADKMPAQRKISDVQKNMNGTRTALPTVSASNMYAPTPTGNNSEDVGLRIMNSLTSK